MSVSCLASSIKLMGPNNFMPEKRKILFVSHDASRSGAPMVLLTFLRWLKKNTGIEITILLKRTGVLHNEFAALAETFCWRPGIYKPVKHDIISRIIRKIKKPAPFVPLPKELESKSFDLIYLNTVDSLDLAPLLKEQFKCPALAHIHENSFSIKSLFENALAGKNRECIDHYIAVSGSTREGLVKNYNLTNRDVSIVYECIDINNTKAVDDSISNALKKEFKPVGNEFVVGGSGISQWRKGLDLFLYTAAYIKRHFSNPGVKFIWVGEITPVDKVMLDYEVDRLNISDQVVFAGVQTAPNNYFRLFDVFLLSSREDPFPLVCLEAAALQKPVICFQEAGGMNEFVAAGGGASVEYANIEALAHLIMQLKNDKSLLGKMGAEAAKTVANYDVNIIAPMIIDIIDHVW